MLEKIENLSRELEKNELVSNFISVLNIPLLQSGTNDLGELVKHVPSLVDADINKTLVRREFADSPLYTNNLVSRDLKNYRTIDIKNSNNNLINSLVR